ncbi:MAG: DegV family protein [Firmicutes bacterium]|nr:DegV family protein [Bacillota bacterium]
MDKKIKLFADSAADLPHSLQERYDIGVVPLSVIFGDREFKDGVDLSIVEFWEKLLASEELPATNQANPHDFVTAFEPFIKEGYTILYIGVSSKLSGTLQSAHLAKELLNTDQIHIFDSKTASIGETLLLVAAGEMLRQGHSLDAIWQQLEREREESGAYFTIDSLTHLVKGGRLTKTQGLVGSMLKIKPILKVTPEGTIEVEDKIRSTKKALQTMVAKAQEHKIDFSKKRVAIVHSYGAEFVQELKDLVVQELRPQEILVSLIGPTVGTHAGPGGLALFF